MYVFNEMSMTVFSNISIEIKSADILALMLLDGRKCLFLQDVSEEGVNAYGVDSCKTDAVLVAVVRTRVVIL